jgi:uncharacterized protein (DUF58 family)
VKYALFKIATYAKETSQIPIYLSNSLDRNTLTFSFLQQTEVTLELATEQNKVLIPYRAQQRGRLNPQRVMVKSYFPMGLLRCWSHVDLAIEVLVYPATIEAHIPLLSQNEQDEGQQANSTMGDFAGIREYIQGESISRISWKHVARNQHKLVSKQFSDNDDTEHWLSLNQLSDRDIEMRLSKLAYAVEYYCSQNIVFGLNLNKTRIAPGTGENHKHLCLEALALW